MKIYTLKKSQLIPVDINSCWEFFSNPANLQIITPPDLGLIVKSELAESMYAGMLIEYDISLIAGIKQTWVTEITHVDRPNYFVDEQRFGPYKLWHHQHHFEQIDEAIVKVSDTINYSLPFDPLSRVIHDMFVAGRLDQIFEYRKQALEEKFGTITPQ